MVTRSLTTAPGNGHIRRGVAGGIRQRGRCRPGAESDSRRRSRTRPGGGHVLLRPRGRHSQSVPGHLAATLLLDGIVERTDLPNLDQQRRTWDLLRLTRMPTVRVECGNLASPGDRSRLDRSGVHRHPCAGDRRFRGTVLLTRARLLTRHFWPRYRSCSSVLRDCASLQPCSSCSWPRSATYSPIRTRSSPEPAVRRRGRDWSGASGGRDRSDTDLGCTAQPVPRARQLTEGPLGDLPRPGPRLSGGACLLGDHVDGDLHVVAAQRGHDHSSTVVDPVPASGFE